MSVLETPRLFFAGKITWDPIVTNNTTNYWDVETSKPVIGSSSATAYRDEVVSQVSKASGNWNPDGTHRSIFYETTVTGVDTGSGPSTRDELVGVPVGFAGMLVDVNPYISNTSQLFFDQFSVGIQGGPRIVMASEGPMVATHIVARNPSLEIAGKASAIWQGSATDGASIDVHDSQVLTALHDAISSGEADGLTVRWNAYRTIYFNNDAPPSDQPYYAALKQRLEGGGFQPNPARSWIVGVVGLYRRGESAATPGDRQLKGSLNPQPGSAPPRGGAAFARVQGDRLHVDLGNSLSETDPNATKADLGTLVVSAGETAIGSLTYDQYAKRAYEATAGIFSFDLTTPEQVRAVADENLRIAAGGGAFGTAALEESELRAVVVDRPTLYFEGVETGSVTIQVSRRGEPVTAPVAVQIAESQRNETGGPPPPPPFVPPLQVLDATTDDAGLLTVTFGTGESASPQVHTGASQFVFTPYEGTAPAPPTGGTDPDADCYVSVRVTPEDAHIAEMDPTWDNVHEYVLRDWEALAPCMDNWLKLGDEAQVRSMADRVKQLTSREHFDRFTYMPVTRGMSAGQRTLLHAWCDDPAPPSGESSMRDAASAERPDFGADVDMSRGLGGI